MRNGYVLNRTSQAATIYELDDRLSRHLYGIATVEEYYMLSSVCVVLMTAFHCK